MKLINVKMMDEKFPVGLCTLGKPWTSSERVETRQGIGPVWSLGCGVKVSLLALTGLHLQPG